MMPMALTTLLLDAPRLVTVSEWLDDPSEPTWKAHEATLRFRVDFGSAAGARAGMDLFGIAPDERWHATLDEVDIDSAVATMKLERFSPWEAVEVPTRGIRFSTRSPQSDSETWPTRLEHWLTELEPGRRFQVINAGVPGALMLDQIIRLQAELYAFEPDVLVLYANHGIVSASDG